MDRVMEDLGAAIGALAAEDRSGWIGPARADRVVELLAARDRLDAEVHRAVGDWDRDDAWQADGAFTPVNWLAWRAPVTRSSAARLVRTARLARDHDRTGKALAAGDVTVAHVEAMAKAAHRRENLFAEHEDTLIDAARTVEPQRFTNVARYWRAAADQQAATGDAWRAFEERGVHLSPTFGGTVALGGSLEAEVGALVMRALDAYAPPDPVGGEHPPRTLSQRRADALADLCAAAVRVPSPRGRPSVGIDVVIDADTLTGALPADLTRGRCKIDGLGPVAPETIRRLACDASLRRMLAAPSQILDVGRATPVIAEPLRRAVIVRDRGCVFPGCAAPTEWCDIHHLVPRHRGGPTATHNLVLLCRRHHVLCHEGRWLLYRLETGEIAARPPEHRDGPVGAERAPP